MNFESINSSDDKTIRYTVNQNSESKILDVIIEEMAYLGQFKSIVVLDGIRYHIKLINKKDVNKDN